MKRASFLPGVLIASSLIGVIVALGGMGWAALSDRGGAGAAVAAPVAIMLAVPIGFAASILPNLIGTALLAGLGRGNIGVRLPVMWALAGAAAGWGIAAAFGRGDPGGEGGAVMAGIGSISALLCRWGTRWD